MADFSDVIYKTAWYPGDVISHYFNLKTLETDPDFDSWTVHLCHAYDFTVSYPDIITLTKDIVSGTSYRFYFQDFTVPSIPVGCYRLVIVDNYSTQVMYVSNIIEVIDDTTDTYLIRYKNAKNMFSYNYEALTSFYNVTRVRLLRWKPEKQSKLEGYEQIDDSFQIVRFTNKKTYEFVTDWFDEEAHDALEAAINHSTFEVRFNNKWNTFKRTDKDNYESNFEQDYPTIEGRIRLELTSEASSNKAI